MRTRLGSLRSRVTSRGELLRSRTVRRARRMLFESLEDRSLLATDITFDTTTRVLALAVGAADESVVLSVSGTTLSVSSSDTTTADAGAQTLGFVAGPTGTNSGSISAASDVRRIDITGSAGTQTVIFGSGTFTGTTVVDGAEDIENVRFFSSTTFDNISGNAGANSNLDVTATANITVDANVATTANGNITFSSDRITIETAVNAGAGRVTLQPVTAGREIDLGVPVVAEVEPNDSIAGAQALGAVPDAVGVSGTGDGTFDYYSFSAAAGQTFSFETTSGNFDTELFLYDSGGTLLAADDDSGLGLLSRLSFTFAAAGTYAIAVGEFDSLGSPGGATGNVPDAGDTYTLEIDPQNALVLTDKEIDLITAGVIHIGNDTSGSLTVTAAISPALSTTLFLQSGASISDSATGSLAAPNVAAQAAGGVTLSSAASTFTNLEAETDTGSITIVHTGDLTLGGVTPDLTGLRVLTSGDIIIINAGSIFLADQDGLEVIRGGDTSGSVILIANGATADVSATVDRDAISVPRGSLTVIADRDILFGAVGTDHDNDVRANASITFVAGRNITIDGFSDVSSDDFGQNTGGSVTFVAGTGVAGGNINITNLNGDDASVGASGNAGGSVTLVVVTADGFLNLTAPTASALFSNSGSITIVADQVLIAGASGMTANNGSVTIQQTSAAHAINLGTAADVAGTLGLSDAELDRIFTPTLRIGNTGNTGSITVSAPLTPANLTTLSLATGGGILDANALNPDVTVANLAVQSASGISLDTAISVLAFENTGGAVDIANSGALTIDAVDGINTSSNTGTTTTISAASPLTIAVNTTTAGNTTYTAGEISDFPACADDLTVNPGVTVSVTAGNLVLQAGDDIVLGAGSTLTASGSVSLVAGFGDLDACGTIIDNGATINSGGGVAFCVFGDFSVGTINAPGQTVTLRSFTGAILDGNGAAVNVTAAALAMQAETGIGTGVDGALETAVSSLEALTTTGGIFVTNTGDLNIGGVVPDPACITVTLNGVQANTSGNIELVNAGSIILAGAAVEDIRTASGNVLVQADGATANVETRNDSANAIDSDSGNVTIIAGQDILLGSAATDNFGDIEANGNISLTAARDVIVDENTFVDASGTGFVLVGAGRNISVLATDGTTGAHIHTEDSQLTLSTGPGGVVTINSGSPTALQSTTNNITINADRVVIGATSGIVASSGTVLIQPVTPGWAIDLGSATDGAASTLELSDAELNRVTAQVLVIGNSTAGDITFTATISPALTSQLELVTGAQIIDGFAATDVIIARLGLTAATGIGLVSNLDLDTQVSNLEATTNTGGIVIFNAGSLAIGGVNDTLTGLSVNTSGNINIFNIGSISLIDDDGVETVRGGSTSGNVSLIASGVSDVTSTVDNDAITAPAGDIAVSAGQDISFGTTGTNHDNDVRASGSVFFTAGRDIIIDGFTDVASDDFGANTGGSVTFSAARDIRISNNNGDDATVSANGTAGGDVNLASGANAFLVLSSPSSVAVFSNSGDVTVNADRVAISATSGITATSGIVTIQQASAAWAINLGSVTDAAATTLELSDAELDRVFTPLLRIGGVANTGNITLSAPISPAGVTTLSLRTAGAIVDGTVAESSDITVANLALRAGTGIGSADDIDTAVTNLAFNNAGGAVNVANIGALTINAVDDLATSANLGTTTTVSAASPLTFAVNTSSVGSATFTAGEISDAPACADDLTVNSGVTVSVSAGDLTLQAGDDVILPLGSTVSASGTLTVTGGFGDLDNCGSVSAFGALAGSTVNIGGGAGEDDFFINPSSAPATVNVFGQAGNDEFFITMSATTAFNIDGGPPVLPTLPGDSLTVDFTGAVNVIFTPGAPGAGTFTASNRQPISFVSIETLNIFDYGDAPDTFGTLQASGGPRHRIFPSGPHMGLAVDFDPDGQPIPAGLGDDTDSDGDDEDGVTFVAPLIPQLDAVAVVNSTGTAFVDAWVDFNGDGTFGADEQIATSFPVVAGNNNILFNVPASAVGGSVFSRFRLSTAGGLGPTGQAENGEVEDHTIQILVCPDNSVQVVNDPVNPGQKILLICGTNGNDVYVIEPRPGNLTQVRVKSTGKVIGIVSNSQFQSIAAFGKEGNDTIIVDARINKPAQLFGNGGNDQLYGAGGADRLHGGDGNDKLFGGNNNDLLFGGAGNDFVYGQNGNDFLEGGDGNDQMWGEAGNDRLFGNAGNDVLAGGAGNDNVFGGLDNDKVFGDGGNDVVVGQEGNDQVYGGQGRDVLIGSEGNDTLFGEQGDDILVAGPTAHDNDELALQSILAEWASSRSYNQRVNNIRTGGGNTGGFAFDAGTVFDDGVVDTLWGKDGQDWFLFGIGDVLKDKAANELVN